MADYLDDPENLLSYVLTHSKTPRHAFHIRHVQRLLDLAGVDEVTADNPGLGANFLGIDEYEADRLVKLARARRSQWSTNPTS